MTPDEQKDFAKAVAAGLSDAHKAESPINPQNIFYALGVAAVVYVGWSFNHTVEGQGEKLNELTEAVGKLVVVSENQQTELKSRGHWMDGIDTYSEQSRMKDQEHDQRLKLLENK